MKRLVRCIAVAIALGTTSASANSVPAVAYLTFSSNGSLESVVFDSLGLSNDYWPAYEALPTDVPNSQALVPLTPTPLPDTLPSLPRSWARWL